MVLVTSLHFTSNQFSSILWKMFKNAFELLDINERAWPKQNPISVSMNLLSVYTCLCLFLLHVPNLTTNNSVMKPCLN